MRTIKQGILVAIEGIDGSGKSLLAHNIANALLQQGYRVTATKEPGGTPLGQQLRTILQTQPVPVDPLAEFLLFAADRAQHVRDLIKPALAQGNIVISDRLHYSSECYQGFGRGLDRAHIQEVNQWVMGTVYPDLTLYVKIDPATALDRVTSRGQERTSFEQRAFIERVAHGFDILFSPEERARNNRSDQLIILDGTRTPEQLTHQAINAIGALINSKRRLDA